MIMDRLDYNIAMIGLLNGSDSHYEKKSVNAIKIANTGTDIRRKVKSISQMLTRDRNEAEDVIKNLLTKNPGAATFCGIPKMHRSTKKKLLFRIIVSGVGTFSSGFSGWLAKQLNPLLGTFSAAHNKNNVDFKEK